jgi:gamma-carbonic anhydrase
MQNENKLFPYQNTFPEIPDSVFLASGVKIVGDVKIGKNSSIWYNTVIRGDVNYVSIGDFTNVQDLSMLHVTNGKFPLNIGNHVTIGHSVTLHGCTLEDYTFVGMGAVLLDGSKVESLAMVAAGAVVKQGFTVPSGKLVAGIPAKIIRDLSDNEMNDIKESALRYSKYAELSADSLKENSNGYSE